MTPDEARSQAKALLQSTDALLGGLLAVAKQLREAVAVLQNTIDQTEPAAKPAISGHVELQNGHLTLRELHSQLALAGIHLEKVTLNAYASTGQIPCIKKGKHRLFIWEDVLNALNSKRKRKRKPNRRDEDTPTPTVTDNPPGSAAEIR